jgi:hypothetical protein
LTSLLLVSVSLVACASKDDPDPRGRETAGMRASSPVHGVYLAPITCPCLHGFNASTESPSAYWSHYQPLPMSVPANELHTGDLRATPWQCRISYVSCVLDVYFIYSICMLHMFYSDVTKVGLVLPMTIYGVFSNVSVVCCLLLVTTKFMNHCYFLKCSNETI